jgi:hypothetical protein
MARSLILFGIVAALLSAGCVPVTEPVGDIDKAEPNKELLGEWKHENDLWIIDRPDVKGNPKGVMRIRIVPNGKKVEAATERETFWFFTATVGKHTYANLMLKEKGDQGANLATEGAYAEWTKSTERGYWVGRLTFKNDGLTLDGGNEKVVEKVMAAEKITKSGHFYQTKPGWLTAYLEKKGSEDIFIGEDEMKFTRVKKR